jgi:hypothetical protein
LAVPLLIGFERVGFKQKSQVRAARVKDVPVGGGGKTKSEIDWFVVRFLFRELRRDLEMMMMKN